MLVSKLVDQVGSYLICKYQRCRGGPLFDTWVGNLSRQDFERLEARTSKRLLDNLSGRVPIIYFGTVTNIVSISLRSINRCLCLLGTNESPWDSCLSVGKEIGPIVLCSDQN